MFATLLVFSLLLSAPDTISSNLDIVSQTQATLRQENGVFLLSMEPGDAYLLHPMEPGADRLTIKILTDVPIELTLIPNISTDPEYTFEFQRQIKAGNEFQEINFSLNHILFEQAENFGIKFTAQERANIQLQEIALELQGFFAKVIQPLKDYFRIAPYSGFTVNVFPTPRIYGRSAFVYLLPLFLVMFFFLVFSKKYRHKALIGLLILWLVTDVRMSYEFLKYQIRDYQTWTNPRVGEKSFRTYDDFYVFAEWVSENLPAGTAEINFIQSTNEHFPRLLQYYLYPIRVLDEDGRAELNVAFREEINAEQVIAEYKHNSKIFRNK